MFFAKITAHSPDFSTTAQIAPGDIADLAAHGFRSIINNRPDYEGGDGQPTSDTLAAAAALAGIDYAFLPVVPAEITPEVVAEFAALLGRLPKPILGFCKGGGRSAKLYRLAIEG